MIIPGRANLIIGPGMVSDKALIQSRTLGSLKETHVQNEEKRQKIVRNSHGDGRAVKSPAEFEHEQPVLQEAERSADEQRHRNGEHENPEQPCHALSLEPDEVFVTGAVCLGAEGIEARR
ncbi:hypothetical protein HG531_009117 [Fusarium graminearum]|nr:hypothetical protein HG531_009117 [Fusarium graminearum]